MSTGYQIKDQSALHFVTFQIIDWIDLFSRKIYRDIVIESLRFCQKNKGLEIYAFVIMSNHLHLLIRSSSAQLSQTIKEFKSFTAKEFLKVIDSEIESRKIWMLKQFEFAAQSHCRNPLLARISIRATMNYKKLIFVFAN